MNPQGYPRAHPSSLCFGFFPFFLANSTQILLWCNQVSRQCETRTLKSPLADGFDLKHDYKQLLLITGL